MYRWPRFPSHLPARLAYSDCSRPAAPQSRGELDADVDRTTTTAMFPLRDDAPRWEFPWVNSSIIALNVVVFLYELSLPHRFLERVFIPSFGLVPYRLQAWVHGAPVPWLAALFPLFSSMFLHGGWLHLLGNMWMLYIFGDNVEDLFGHGRYLGFYLCCGLVAALTQVIFSWNSVIPMIGASGAIAGVMGAYLVRFPRARVLTLVFLLFFFFLWEIPAWVILGYWFLLQFLSGAHTLALGRLAAEGGGIAWFAHIGGFLTGVLLVRMGWRRRRW